MQAEWDAAFRGSGDCGLKNIEVESGHFVLANENCDMKELQA